jgi:hypothetical protein
LKTIKAMGLNAVCAYLFWNYHEWREGRYDWAAQRDAAEFCRLAQEEGLWVILRPGPYACAEWEMGGMPWWLLKHDGDAFLRTRDEAYLAPARRWLKEVGRVLGPQQVTHGGPILMVQVENEYGFFGDDVGYLRVLRQALLDAGFDVPLFQCNPTNAVARTHIPELFTVANFGSDPVAGFKALDAVQKGPRMCGEYYSGWFDTWGSPHHSGGVEGATKDIAAMLKANGSFSLYMAHGGTTFGLWGGCDRPFRPDTTSYDYDAPIGEAGWIGAKFDAYRAAITPFLAPGEKLPEPPPRMPVMTISPFALAESVPVKSALPARVVKDVSPRPIEQYDISRGLVAYRVTLPAGPAGVVEVARARDLAWITAGRQAGRHLRHALPPLQGRRHGAGQGPCELVPRTRLRGRADVPRHDAVRGRRRPGLPPVRVGGKPYDARVAPDGRLPAFGRAVRTGEAERRRRGAGHLQARRQVLPRHVRADGLGAERGEVVRGGQYTGPVDRARQPGAGHARAAEDHVRRPVDVCADTPAQRLHAAYPDARRVAQGECHRRALRVAAGRVGGRQAGGALARPVDAGGDGQAALRRSWIPGRQVMTESARNDRAAGGATVWDVASRAGVSAMTVSRVINGNMSVSVKNREKVMRAIGELNYEVNVAARAARIGTLRVGLLYSNPSEAFLSAFLVGAARAAPT